jgi:hypothetical protein
MILDDTLEFADAVAANGTGVSQIIGDYHDQGATPTTRDLGPGEPCWFVVEVTTAYSGGTSAEFQFRSSTATALTGGTTTTHITTGAIAVASLPAGTMLAYRLPIGTYQRYIGAWLVTVGAVAAGAVNVFLTHDVPKNVIYPNAVVAS